MVTALCMPVSDSAAEVMHLLNYAQSSLISRGFSVSQNPIISTARQRKEHSGFRTRSALTVKELEFKTSFDDYLKEMKSLQTNRDRNNTMDEAHSKNGHRRKRIVKKNFEEGEEMGSSQEPSTAPESLRKSGSYEESTFSEQDSRKKSALRKDQKRSKISSGKKSDGRDSQFLDLERAAFKPLEYDDVVDGPRVTRMDMEERIQKLAKCLNGADIDMPEWKFSEMMRSAQIRFSDYSILRVVQILGKLGNWRRVLQVIEWTQSRERFKSHKTRYIYTAALDALGKARRPVEAYNLFTRMQEQMASYPDIVAYRCIAVILGQAGYMKELFDVIDSMKAPPRRKLKNDLLEKWDPRLEPDVIVYNAVLNACVRRKKWEGAFWVLQQMNQQGLKPSSTTYGLVMEVMLACGKYSLVHDFFKKVQKSFVPNALIYRVLVNTLWKEGKFDEAIIAVSDMERRGIVGNASLYYDLARCLCSAGRCNEALKQIDKICKVANKPLVVTFTGLIQACLDSGNIQDGSYVFNHMKRFCSPNLVTYNIMLKAFIDHGMFEQAMELFLVLLENTNLITCDEDYKVRVLPDIYSFNTMLDACAVKQKWDDFEFVYKQMLSYGHHFNAKRHLRLVLDAHRAGKEAVLEMTWSHLVEAERAPPPPLVIEMFSLRLEQNRSKAALSCIINYASIDPQPSSRKSWSKFFSETAHRFDRNTLDDLVREADNFLLTSSESITLHHLAESCKDFLRTERAIKVAALVS